MQEIKSIYVNLPVKDLEKTRAFWEGLGFGFNAQFSDEKALCLILKEESIYAMLLHELLQATLALAETPLMKLKENKNLMKDIKRIVSNQNFDSIMNALRNEKFNEENFTPNPIGLNPESLEFTKAYVNYQNVNYEVFAKNIEAKSFFSVLPNVKNSKPLPENLIQKLSEKVDASNEAKKFWEERACLANGRFW